MKVITKIWEVDSIEVDQETFEFLCSKINEIVDWLICKPEKEISGVHMMEPGELIEFEKDTALENEHEDIDILALTH